MSKVCRLMPDRGTMPTNSPMAAWTGSRARIAAEKPARSHRAARLSGGPSHQRASNGRPASSASVMMMPPWIAAPWLTGEPGQAPQAAAPAAAATSD